MSHHHAATNMMGYYQHYEPPPWSTTMNWHMNRYSQTTTCHLYQRISHPKGLHEKSTSKYSMPGSASAWHGDRVRSENDQMWLFHRHDTKSSGAWGLGSLCERSSTDITNITKHTVDGQNPAKVFSNPSRLARFLSTKSLHYNMNIISMSVSATRNYPVVLLGSWQGYPHDSNSTWAHGSWGNLRPCVDILTPVVDA